MLSKLLHPRSNIFSYSFLVPKCSKNCSIVKRRIFVPPTHFDTPYPDNLRVGYALKKNWELWPLFIITGFALFVTATAIIWATKNKVDVVFTTHNRKNISRTMDLRKPTFHKMYLIGPPPPPWPEMADALDKLEKAEKRALLRASACATE